MIRQLALLLACSIAVLGQQQLTCYNCAYNANPDVEPLCVTTPDDPSLPPVTCNMTGGRGCYIKSQYEKDGTVRSFQRGCEIFNGIPEGCTDSEHFKDCLEMCYEDLCNGNPIITTAEPYTGSTEEDSGSDVIRASTLLILSGVLWVNLLWRQ